MNILLTGTPGSGKSVMAEYGRLQGDKRFFDSDEVVGLCEWREHLTGKILGSVEEYPENGKDEWYEKYGKYWREDFLRQFIIDNPDLILCGSSENIAECYKLFDKIIILRKTEKELLSNLMSEGRTNSYGKTSKQRSGFMKWQNYLIKNAKGLQYYILIGNITKDAYKQVLTIVNV